MPEQGWARLGAWCRELGADVYESAQATIRENHRQHGLNHPMSISYPSGGWNSRSGHGRADFWWGSLPDLQTSHWVFTWPFFCAPVERGRALGSLPLPIKDTNPSQLESPPYDFIEHELPP